MNTTFYIVRHGETEYNVSKIIQGQSDSGLTPLGLEQAWQLAEEFKDKHFDVVFSSDLLRAKKTAEIISANHQLVVNTNKLLRERKFGKYEGRLSQEFHDENKKIFERLYSLPEAQQLTFKFEEDYESEAELAARMLLFLRELAVTYEGKTVLIVSHGGIMRALLMHLGFATMQELRGPSIDNTAYIKLESDGIDFFILETTGIRKKTNI